MKQLVSRMVVLVLTLLTGLLSSSAAQASPAANPQVFHEGFFEALFTEQDGCSRQQVHVSGVEGSYLSGPGTGERAQHATGSVAVSNTCTDTLESFEFGPFHDLRMRISPKSVSFTGTLLLQHWQDPSRQRSVAVDLVGAATSEPYHFPPTHWSQVYEEAGFEHRVNYQSTGFYSSGVTWTGTAITAQGEDLLQDLVGNGYLEINSGALIDVSKDAP